MRRSYALGLLLSVLLILVGLGQVDAAPSRVRSATKKATPRRTPRKRPANSLYDLQHARRKEFENKSLAYIGKSRLTREERWEILALIDAGDYELELIPSGKVLKLNLYRDSAGNARPATNAIVGGQRVYRVTNKPAGKPQGDECFTFRLKSSRKVWFKVPCLNYLEVYEEEVKIEIETCTVPVDLLICKTVGGGPLKVTDCPFLLYKLENGQWVAKRGEKENDKLTPDANGRILLMNLHLDPGPGMYWLQEKGPLPKNYEAEPKQGYFFEVKPRRVQGATTNLRDVIERTFLNKWCPPPDIPPPDYCIVPVDFVGHKLMRGGPAKPSDCSLELGWFAEKEGKWYAILKDIQPRADGLIRITDLHKRPGKYWLREVGIPEGYIPVPEDGWQFEVKPRKVTGKETSERDVIERTFVNIWQPPLAVVPEMKPVIGPIPPLGYNLPQGYIQQSASPGPISVGVGGGFGNETCNDCGKTVCPHKRPRSPFQPGPIIPRTKPPNRANRPPFGILPEGF